MYDLDVGQLCYNGPAKLPLEPKSGTKKSWGEEADLTQFKFA